MQPRAKSRLVTFVTLWFPALTSGFFLPQFCPQDGGTSSVETGFPEFRGSAKWKRSNRRCNQLVTLKSTIKLSTFIEIA